MSTIENLRWIIGKRVTLLGHRIISKDYNRMTGLALQDALQAKGINWTWSPK